MKTVKYKKAFFTTKWLTYTALMTGLVVATSFIPSVPVTVSGNLYWCDCIIFIAAYLLDPLAAFIAGGVGTLLFDVIKGNGYMMFASLIIHGLQAVATSAILHFVFAKLPKKLEPVWALIASIVGGAIVILGYFIQRYYILHTEWIYIGDKAIANVIQEIVGISIAMFICYATTFKKQLKSAHLLPDFGGEVLEKKKVTDEVTENENSEAA